MHHAAMANKKEMMFLLARLGCDWRARAEGIDVLLPFGAAEDHACDGERSLGAQLLGEGFAPGRNLDLAVEFHGAALVLRAECGRVGRRRRSMIG